jgi:hypothetical protein
MTKVEKTEGTFDPITGRSSPAVMTVSHECAGCSALGPDECFLCPVCGRRDARLNPTDDDREALERALLALRQLERPVLERASSRLMSASVNAADHDHVDEAKALIHLSRIAYVLAFEGLRG